MRKFQVAALCAIVALSACNSPVTKKVLIFGKGGITANGNDITMKDGSGSVEETVELRGEEGATWNVQTPSGKTSIEIPKEPGFYVLNLKADTLVGSQQIIGKDISSNRTITQEELKVKIDSLTKLTTGANVSSTAHTFFITPNKLEKISENVEAKVFGPFNKIPATLEANKDGKAPELYKLYTNKEMRELIDNFKKMSY